MYSTVRTAVAEDLTILETPTAISLGEMTMVRHGQTCSAVSVSKRVLTNPAHWRGKRNNSHVYQDDNRTIFPCLPAVQEMEIIDMHNYEDGGTMFSCTFSPTGDEMEIIGMHEDDG